MAKKTVKVHAYNDSNGVFRVYPGVAVLQGEDDMVLVNHLARKKIVCTVPAGPFDTTGHSYEVAAKGTGPRKTSKRGDALVVYTVAKGTKRGTKAKGNSNPILIVE